MSSNKNVNGAKISLCHLLTLMLLLCASVAFGQETAITHSQAKTYKKDLSLVTGFNQGSYSFAELGLAINHYGKNRHPFSLNYFISNEIKLNQDLIIGPKAGIWIGGGYAMGLNLIYYTDFDKGSVVFRPEIGIGIQKVKLVYGYNWNVNKGLFKINQHQVGLTYCFTLKRIKAFVN